MSNQMPKEANGAYKEQVLYMYNNKEALITNNKKALIAFNCFTLWRWKTEAWLVDFGCWASNHPFFYSSFPEAKNSETDWSA